MNNMKMACGLMVITVTLLFARTSSALLTGPSDLLTSHPNTTGRQIPQEAQQLLQPQNRNVQLNDQPASTLPNSLILDCIASTSDRLVALLSTEQITSCSQEEGRHKIALNGPQNGMDISSGLLIDREEEIYLMHKTETTETADKSGTLICGSNCNADFLLTIVSDGNKIEGVGFEKRGVFITNEGNDNHLINNKISVGVFNKTGVQITGTKAVVTGNEVDVWADNSYGIKIEGTQSVVTNNIITVHNADNAVGISAGDAARDEILKDPDALARLMCTNTIYRNISNNTIKKTDLADATGKDYYDIYNVGGQSVSKCVVWEKCGVGGVGYNDHICQCSAEKGFVLGGDGRCACADGHLYIKEINTCARPFSGGYVVGPDDLPQFDVSMAAPSPAASGTITVQVAPPAGAPTSTNNVNKDVSQGRSPDLDPPTVENLNPPTGVSAKVTGDGNDDSSAQKTAMHVGGSGCGCDLGTTPTSTLQTLLPYLAIAFGGAGVAVWKRKKEHL